MNDLDISSGSDVSSRLFGFRCLEGSRFGARLPKRGLFAQKACVHRGAVKALSRGRAERDPWGLTIKETTLEWVVELSKWLLRPVYHPFQGGF